MISGLMGAIAGFITHAISSMGYAGIAALMAIESACIPLPSEVIMPFSGYLASKGQFSLLLVATVGAIGCNIGSTLAYFIGAYGGRRAVERWGRYILLSQSDLDRADRWFSRYGSAAVFVSRLLPLVRTFISLPAGIARMPFWKFQIYTFFGSWPWCLVLAYVGLKLGQAWDQSPALRNTMHALNGVVLVAILIGVGFYVRRFFKSREA
ncbi:DedA family protein [Thioclava sp. F36-6]|uniref:DedA family protein n=1 Tax=Thioclava sp. F36-6 TaxID=1915316 RepID=UPI001AEFB329|nr:DedA family protein [Thioclava sp. F36-6]